MRAYKLKLISNLTYLLITNLSNLGFEILNPDINSFISDINFQISKYRISRWVTFNTFEYQLGYQSNGYQSNGYQFNGYQSKGYQYDGYISLRFAPSLPKWPNFIVPKWTHLVAVAAVVVGVVVLLVSYSHSPIEQQTISTTNKSTKTNQTQQICTTCCCCCCCLFFIATFAYK